MIRNLLLISAGFMMCQAGKRSKRSAFTTEEHGKLSILEGLTRDVEKTSRYNLRCKKSRKLTRTHYDLVNSNEPADRKKAQKKYQTRIRKKLSLPKSMKKIRRKQLKLPYTCPEILELGCPGH